jgi:hypothetical protein
MPARRSNSLEIRASLEGRLGPAKDAADEEIRFNCPKCKHSDHRLYINPEVIRTDYWTGHQKKGWFICFQCSWRGPLSFLLGQLGIEVDDLVPDTHDLRLRLNSGPPLAPPPEPPLVFQDRVPVLINDRAREYLLERGLSEGQIMESGAFLRHHDSYRRIHFPEFDLDGGIRYCVSRRYLPDDPWPKYMSAGSRRQRGCYRLTDCTPGAEVTLVEGPLDALVVWDNTAALYGKFMSSEQRAMLLRASSRFCIAFDSDAQGAAAVVADYLYAVGAEVRIVVPPAGEDPASMGRSAFISLASNATRMGPTDFLRKKLQA